MVALTSFLHILPLLLATAQGQLAGRVGPLTTAAEKNATRTCNVLDHGAVADNATDVGQPMIDAFADCGRGGVIYIPPGDYLQTTWVHLTNGSAFAIQLDGIIYRGAAPSSQSCMFEISSSSDFEVFSSTSRGGIQGSGYLYHQSGNFVGPRLLHVSGGSDWSVHDLALVDSPMFHFVIQGASNGEVYNMAIRGGDHGGLDGIDVSGTNIWVHDVMVTNKDECVTVKTGSKNILVESIYCNSSGGCAMGSLGAGTNVSDVTYRNVYTWSSNQMFMIKSNGGSGTVSNVLFENFIGHGNAYSLDFDTAWSSMSTIEGDGIAYSNITFRNWKGTEIDGEDRPLIKVKCPALTPCTDLAIEEFALWNEEGHYALHVCEHSYGSGYCLSNATVPVTGTAGGYTTTQYINTPPAGYSATTMAEDLATAFGTSASIPIPTIPTSFYPSLTPYSTLAGASAFPSSSAYPSSSSHPSSSALPSYRENATASVRTSTPAGLSTLTHQTPISSSVVSPSSEPPSACYFTTSSPDVTVASSASSSMSTASASSAYDSYTGQRVPPRPHGLGGQHLQFHQHHGGRHPYH